MLIWLWGIGQFQWTISTRAVAFFCYFTLTVFLLDIGYRWIRPTTDWSVRSGLFLIMFYCFTVLSLGHYALIQLTDIDVDPLNDVQGFRGKEEMPLIWSAIVGLLHAVIIGIMGMAVLIWRRQD